MASERSGSSAVGEVRMAGSRWSSNGSVLGWAGEVDVMEFSVRPIAAGLCRANKLSHRRGNRHAITYFFLITFSTLIGQFFQRSSTTVIKLTTLSSQLARSTLP